MAAKQAMSLAGKTLYVTGGSRGIGLAIAKRAAADGANVVLAAKTADPHPNLPGTIFTAAKECEAVGGNALPIQVDVMDDESNERAIEAAVAQFGGIDILINNASAIDNSGTLDVRAKKCVRARAAHPARGAPGAPQGSHSCCGVTSATVKSTPAPTRYHLMHNINGRGTFWTSKLALPHLLKAENPHVLNLSPPLDMDPRWFKVAP